MGMKLMATRICNLTDARYFAARMADYLVLDPALTNVASISTVKEMQGWIDGVTWVLQGDVSSDELDFILRETGIETGLSTSSRFLEKFNTGFLISEGYVSGPDGRWFVLQDDLPPLETLGDFVGLVVSGGSEEKVGFKSFDQIDSVLDQLETLGQ